MFSCACARTLGGGARVCSVFVGHQSLPPWRPGPGLVDSPGEQLHQRLLSLCAMLSGPEAVYRMHRRTGAAIGEHQLCGMHSNR